MWAHERGFELPAQPEDEGCAVRWLCFAALLRESNPPVRAAAGDSHSMTLCHTTLCRMALRRMALSPPSTPNFQRKLELRIPTHRLLQLWPLLAQLRLGLPKRLSCGFDTLDGVDLILKAPKFVEVLVHRRRVRAGLEVVGASS